MLAPSRLPFFPTNKTWQPIWMIIASFGNRKIVSGGISTLSSPFMKEVLITVMDCTGHGVPGALMTMIAGSSLDRAMLEVGWTDPALLLQKMNLFVMTALNQHHAETASDDGLDIGVCFVDKSEESWSMPEPTIDLYCVSNGEIRLILADRYSIGYKNSKLDFNYTNHTVPVDAKTTFYMRSDGICHQTGGPRLFCLARKDSGGFFLEHHEKPLAAQRGAIEQAIENYRGDEPQLDDITVVGFIVS